MEYPVLKFLFLPENANMIVKQFLRMPHPTAKLIKELGFEQGEILEADPGLYVAGEGLRILEQDIWPPTLNNDMEWVCKHGEMVFTHLGCFYFDYNEITGDPTMSRLKRNRALDAARDDDVSRRYIRSLPFRP